MKIPSIAELVNEAMATERFSAHSPQEHAIRLALWKILRVLRDHAREHDSREVDVVADSISEALAAPNA